MKITPITELMHAVLDGEATAEETRELERALAADPAARSEFGELKRLFDELATVAMTYPPEGLVSSVMASLSQQAQSEDGIRQPFTAPRVSGSNFRDAPDSGSGRSARDTGDSQQWPNFRSNKMSEQTGGSKRKIWIGGAIAAAAVVLVVSSGIDFPPGSKDTSGTIVPATRYKAPQNTAEDVKVGTPGAASSTTIPKTDDAAGNAAGSAANNAAAQAAGTAAGTAANNAAAQAAGTAAGSAANNAAAQAAGTAAGTAANNAAFHAGANAAGSAASNAAAQAAGTAAGSAANNAAFHAGANAAGSASSNAAAQAAGTAAGSAANNAAAQAAGNAAGSAAASNKK